MACPQCGYSQVVPLIELPVDPLFNLESAAALVPCTVASLKAKLRRCKDKLDPAQYRQSGRRQHRLLSGHDIRVLRAFTVGPLAPNRQPKSKIAPDPVEG